MDNWDPLALNDSAAPEIISAARKREIHNILKSYVGFFDPFCELIQNALDAVDMRERRLKEQGYCKHLWITIDLKENRLSVTDNGIGFSQDQFRMFLTPSISFKNTGDTRGNKGVGATYLAYGFNYLQMGTKCGSYNTLAEIQNGREWVDDDKASVARPVVKESALLHKAFSHVDRGSTFTLGFFGNVRPKTLGWIGATTADQWKTLLLVKTPLGQVLPDGHTAETAFDLEVIASTGETTTILGQPCSYVYPHSVVTGNVRIATVLSEQQRLLDADKDPSKLPAKFKRLNAVYDFWNSTQLKALNITEEEKVIIDRYRVWAYGFFCYSAPKVFDRYSDERVRLRKGLRVIRGGLQLATNAMPQGELITIPLTSNIGYQNQSHIVVHLDNADPDLGRKGFQPELQKLGERIAVAIVTKLKQWRHLLLTDRGTGGAYEEELALDEWINTQKEYEQAHRLSLSHKHFFIPVNEISITAEPRSEQDVVALFNQLVAGGVIRGVQLMAASSHKQYDGLFRYHLKAPLAHHMYDETDNPLGLQDTQHPEGFVTKPYVLEFKHCFNALIEDFENEEKYASAINLAVVWEMGTRYKERYQVVPLLTPDNLHLRQFHGVTHELYDDNTGEKRMDVIVLSELITFLNDRPMSLKEQSERYGKTE